MPQFLCDEMQDCLKLYYSLKPDDRIFPVTKYYLNHEMERDAKHAVSRKSVFMILGTVMYLY